MDQIRKLIRCFFRPVPLLILGVLLVGVVFAVDWYKVLPPEATASYVGTAKCAECHANEHRQWIGSHHDRAMEVANEEAVLGDFDDAEFTYCGVTSRMFKKGGKFFIHTEGPDSEFHDYEIKYTFGIDPLQQYMVEFPDGRVQVLRVSWDVPGKRWFYVTPPDVIDERILPGDPLHWTGNAQNWNHTCAECHSTDLRKNYDLETNTYHTTFEEIDVNCEACHGPGSLHVDIAESHLVFWDRHRGYGIETLAGINPKKQVESCAACHARRGTSHASFRPGDKFLDDFDPALLHAGLYHADGQILDEVYVYGSFLQSKMIGEGVYCTNCHDPHTLTLKFEGNRLCGQCHEQGKYDTPAHHYHVAGEEGSQCVECHMRSQTYMVIDPRRDHSFRVPRPDLTVTLGTPNACADCHTEPEESAEWAAEKVREWYGDKRADDPHFAPAFAAARKGKDDADELLASVVRRPRADIARATAVSLLGGYDTEKSRNVRLKALTDDSPLVRLTAVRSLQTMPPRDVVKHLAPRLTDSNRGVRIAAARRLAPLPEDAFGRKQRDALTAAMREYEQSQSLALDRAPPHMNLGQIAEARGRLSDANARYRWAIRQEPYLTGPRSQLSAVLERQLSEKIRARQATPKDVKKVQEEVHRLRTEETDNLARDMRLIPNDIGLHYRYGLSLYLLGRNDEAEKVFLDACELDPNSYDCRLVLALLYEKQKKWDAAITSLKVLEKIRPGDPAVRGILARIRAVRPPRKP